MANVIKSVKQFMALWQREDTGAYIPFEQSYAILLRNLNEFDTNVDITELFNHIQNNLHDVSHSVVGKSVLKYLKAIIDTIQLENPAHQHMAFYSDDVFIWDKNKGNIPAKFLDPVQERSAEEQNTDSGIVILRKGKDEFLWQFLQRIKDTVNPVENLTNEDWENMHRSFRANNLWNNMVVAFRSMRPKNPMLGITRYVKGSKKEQRYIENRMAGVRPIFVSSIQEALKSTLEAVVANTIAGNEDYNIEKMLESLPRDEAMAETNMNRPERLRLKRARLKSFLTELLSEQEARRFNSSIPAKSVHDAYRALRNILRSIQRDYLNTGLYREVPVYEFMHEQRGFAEAIAQAIEETDSRYSSPNYIRADGKRGYAYQFSSYATEVLKFAKNRMLDKLPYAKDPFMAANLFVRGKLNIHRYIDHDGSKYGEIDDSTRLYKNERPYDWYTRAFLDQFLGYVTNPKFLKTKKFRYIQSVLPISNKPNILGAEVDLIDTTDDKVLRSYIQDLIDQEKILLKQIEEENKGDNFKRLRDDSALVPGKKIADVTVQDVIDEIEARTQDMVNQIEQLELPWTTNVEEFYDAMGIKFDKKIIDGKLDTLADEKFANENPTTDEEKQDLEKRKERFKNDQRKKNGVIASEVYRDAARIFVANYIINGSQMNQLFTGPLQAYKDIYDLIKRMSILFGPGRIGNVNEKLGLPAKSEIVVIKDYKEHAKMFPGMAKHLEGKDFESTDAQGYVTPEYWARLKKSFGVESEVDTILKPVYAAIGEDGIPRGVKYSALVLTDSLVDQFPHLKKLRDAMMANGVDQAVFGSAVKMGSPKEENMIQLDENGMLQIPENPEDFKKATFTVENKHLRLQFNPAHDTISNVTNPSQLTYFPAMSPQSAAKHDYLLRLNAAITELGGSEVNETLKLINGKATKKTSDRIRRLVKKA
jgi:hypothetical protein